MSSPSSIHRDSVSIHRHDIANGDGVVTSGFFGAAVELELNGTTITGTGEFYPEGDIAKEPVMGELEANC